MEKIIKQLKNLRHIRPSEDFRDNSKLTILQTPNHSSVFRFNEIFRFSGAMALTASFMLLIFGGISYLENSPLPLTMAGLNLETLEAEAESLKLDITISEIDKYEIQQDNVSVALSQTITNNPVQFETIVLNKETEGVDLDDPINQDINQALLEIIE